MESVNELKKKLAIAEKYEAIEKEISNAKCPICGGKLEYKIHEPNGVYDIASGEIYCTDCDMFRKEIKWDIMQSYRYTHDGSSKLEMLEELWGSIKYHVK